MRRFLARYACAILIAGLSGFVAWLAAMVVGELAATGATPRDDAAATVFLLQESHAPSIGLVVAGAGAIGVGVGVVMAGRT
jgi:hypothetical protein